jgi:hypothetical protein
MILDAEYSVTLKSDQQMITDLNNLIRERADECRRQGRNPPPTKHPAVVGQSFNQSWAFKPIDLLHKIGKVTTPAHANMAQMSASWATWRYFWAFEPPTSESGPESFRLSRDARRLDPHQKGLLSDELGIGMGTLLAEQFFGAADCVDVSFALEDRGNFQGVSARYTTRPDYIAWNSSNYYVIECKGCQTDSRWDSLDQLRRGLEQVPSLVFLGGDRKVESMAIGTWLRRTATDVFCVDPPNGEPNNSGKIVSADKVSEKTGENSWSIPDSEKFEEHTSAILGMNLLRWVGQHKSAESIMRDTGLSREGQDYSLPDVRMKERHTENGSYLGVTMPILPGLGDKPRMFVGIRDTLLNHLQKKQLKDSRDILKSLYREELSFKSTRTESFSSDGTCMIVEGLPDQPSSRYLPQL